MAYRCPCTIHQYVREIQTGNPLEQINYTPYPHPYGGFLKWSYPQIIHFFLDFHRFSMVNHPAVGVPPFMETPIQIHVFDFHHSVVSYVCPNQSPAALGSLDSHGVLLKGDDISGRENHMGNTWNTCMEYMGIVFFFNAKTRFYPRDGHGDALWQTCDPNLELPDPNDKPTGEALTD